MRSWMQRTFAGIAGVMLVFLLLTGGAPVQTGEGSGEAGESSAVVIDDGAVPLAELPPKGAIPLELMLATGGLLFVGVSLYAQRLREKAKRNRRK